MSSNLRGAPSGLPLSCTALCRVAGGVPFVGAPDTFGKADSRLPAEVSKPRNVQQLAGSAVWFAAILHSSPCKAHDLGDQKRQIADRDLAAGADVDDFRRA